MPRRLGAGGGVCCVVPSGGRSSATEAELAWAVGLAGALANPPPSRLCRRPVETERVGKKRAGPRGPALRDALSIAPRPETERFGKQCRLVETGDLDVGDVFVVAPVEVGWEVTAALEGLVYTDHAVLGE